LTKCRVVLLEWAVIIIVANGQGDKAILNFNPSQLKQTGEQNANEVGPLLAKIGVTRYGEIPFWNSYM
jgi:hypothetical protein